MCLWQKGQEAPLSGARTHPAHSNAFYSDFDHCFRPFKLASNLKSSRGIFFGFLLRPSAFVTQRSQVAPRRVLLALRSLELRAGRDRFQGRALPCGRRRPPGAAGGGTAAGVSKDLGFSLVLIQPSVCVLAAALSSAVGGASLLWVIRHEPKPPSTLSVVCLWCTQHIYVHKCLH